MADLADTLKDSPVDFETAVAYTLHPEMRRLIILYVVGILLLPVGLEMFLTAGRFHTFVGAILEWVVGLVLAIVGAALLFAGLIGTAFKVITDANRIAVEQ